MKTNTLTRAVTLAVAITAATTLIGSANAATASIYFNNDGESQLLPDGDVGGIARFIGALNVMRAADTNDVLTLSAGDNYLSGVQFEAGYNDEALVAIGYDAIGIGNHEFDLGPDNFANFVTDYNAGGGTAPWLSANLDFSGEANLQTLVDAGSLAASTVVTRNGESYGVVGATTGNLGFISSPGNVGVDVDVAGAVQSQIDDLVTNQGINKIIVVSHGQSITEDRDLAANLRHADIVISGGGDDLLANAGDLLNPGDSSAGMFPDSVTDLDGRAVTVVSTQGQYDYIGNLVVEFDDSGEIISTSGGPIRVNAQDGIMEDADALMNIQDPTAAFVSASLNVVATTEVLLDARSDTVRSVETALGSVIADALRNKAFAALNDGMSDTSDGVDETLPLIGILNGGGIRTNSIIAEPGETVTELDVNNVLPFSNTLTVVTDVTTAQLADLLENAVSRVVPGPDGPMREGQGTGRFAQISGLSFVYNITAQALELDEFGNVITLGSRMRKIIIDDGSLGGLVIFDNGEVVADVLLNIATLSFLAGGGDQYFWSFDQTAVDLGFVDAAIVLEFLQDDLGGLITCEDYGSNCRIQVVPIPAALPMFVCALFGLAAFRRRRSA